MATEKYTEGIGRRKTSTARVRITPAKATTVVVNDKPVAEYFAHESHNQDIHSVLGVEAAGVGTYTITAKVSGGGLSSQAEAIRLGIARALVKEKGERRGVLKSLGFLMRDQRAVERKKFGLKKARKRGAWSKR